MARNGPGNDDRERRWVVKKGPLLWGPVAVVVIAGALWLWRTGMPGPATPVVAPAPAPTAETATPAPVAPAFDIVRVAPDGSAVVAGRAAPGAQVSLRADGQEIATARADAQGQFAIVPDKPLAPGGRTLTLQAQGPGGQMIAGAAPVVVAVPERQAPSEGAVAVLAPPDAAPSLLQVAPLPKDSHLGLDIVDYDEHGAIRFAGRGQPGATLRLYVDNTPVGEARAGADGKWTLVPPEGTVPTGQHQLRLDELGAQGKVVARIELPFLRSLMAGQEVPPGRAVVQPGQSLWRIAQHAYGHGIRYWVIYRANRDQIRNPDRIYPGQVFSLPTGGEAAPPPVAVPPMPAGMVTPSMPASSASKSR